MNVLKRSLAKSLNRTRRNRYEVNLFGFEKAAKEEETIDLVSDGSVQITGDNAADTISLVTTGLGSWESRSLSSVYQAATDGFILGIIGLSSGSTSHIEGRVDSTNPPNTTRAAASVGIGSHYYAFGASTQTTVCIHVKRNDYYQLPIR